MKNDSFFSKWKDGILSITPYQMARITYKNTYIAILGIVLGLGATIWNWKSYWWIAIILFAALINTIIIQIGSYKKYMALRKMEEQLNLNTNGG